MENHHQLGIAEISDEYVDYAWDDDEGCLVGEDAAKGNDRAEVGEVSAVLQLAFLELQPFLFVQHLAHLYRGVERAETQEYQIVEIEAAHQEADTDTLEDQVCEESSVIFQMETFNDWLERYITIL